MEGIIVLCVIMAIAIVVIVVSIINNRHLKITKEYSRLYTAINTLNNRFKFNNINTSKLKFNPTFKSKRSLENLDFYRYMANEIANSRDYYSSLFNKIEKNKQDYNDYCENYKKIETYFTEEEFSKYENIKLKYKTFIKCEKQLYKKLKLKQPIMDLIAHVHATYTSPSGKNHYWRDCDFTYYQLKSIIDDIVRQEQEIIRKKQLKDQEAAEKRDYKSKLKEKYAEEKKEYQARLKGKYDEEKREYRNRLNVIRAEERKNNRIKAQELEKQKNRLSQKEKEITQKQQEFEKATQGHIYSADKEVIQEVVVETEIINEQKSISERMRELKDKFNNGEISYEEYKTQRQKLLEEE